MDVVSTGQIYISELIMSDDVTFAQDDNPTRHQDDRTQIQDDTAPADPADSSEVPSPMSIEAWLEKLRSSDRAFYNIMAMEVWSLAKSMDSMVPGFWSRFMENRRSAMLEFVDRRRQENPDAPAPDAPVPDAPPAD
jgi:hypothetical protein